MVCVEPRAGRAALRWWPASLAALVLGLAAGAAQAQPPAPLPPASPAQPAQSSQPEQSQQPAQSQQPVDVETCLTSHLNGQELRQSRKLLESREQFRQCARQECPSAIARDCVDWLGQFERQIPSVSVRVTADGAGRSDARVSVDGVPVESLNGRAIELNPGTHVVRVELAPFAPFETSLIVSEGDQFRVVEAVFASPSRPSPVSQPEQSQQAPIVMERPVPVTAYVFGVVTLAAAANGAGWALSARSLRQEAEETCAPGCRPSSVDVLRQRALIADISWGVSVASLLTTVTLYALRPEVPVEARRPIAFGLDVVPGGAIGSLSVSAF